MSTPSAKPTIRTVAADAGVSVAAVSKVLRNAYGVSDGLRDRVQDSIERLNYRPSTAARGMRGQTYTVGLLLVEMTNPFLPQVVAGVNDVLSAASYKTMMGVGHAELQIETSLIESMLDVRMDGLILIAPRLAGDMLARYARQIPLVAVGHHEPTATMFDTVNSDDIAGARIATAALIARGYTQIEMVSLMPRDSSPFDVYVQREAGYRQAVTAAGLPVRIVRLHERREALDADIASYFARPDLPQAVFCWSDIHAITLLNAARMRGLRVPQDFAIVGYDDTPTCALPLIDLASIDQKGHRLGALAAQSLLDRIGGRAVAHHQLIAPDLVVRSSI